MRILGMIRKSMALLLALVMLLGVLPIMASADYDVVIDAVETEPPLDDELENEPPEEGQPGNENPGTEPPDDNQPGNEPPDDGQTNEEPPNMEFHEDDMLELFEIAMASTDITGDFNSTFLAALRIILNIPSDPILDSDVAEIEVLDLSGRNITGLAGIEHFDALIELNVGWNLLTSLDDLVLLEGKSINTELKHLRASNNNLTGTLNVSNFANLVELEVDFNNLTALVFTPSSSISNTELEILDISNNQIAGTLEVRNINALKVLTANNNELRRVSLHPTAAYTAIDLRQNRIPSIDEVIGRLPGFTIPWDTGNFRFSHQKPPQLFDITLTPNATHTFTPMTYGYASQQLTRHAVIVENSGNQPTGNIAISLSGGAESKFTLSTSNLPSIAVGGAPRSFTVIPRVGTLPGTYNETVTVSIDHMEPKTFNVRFTVTRAAGPDAPGLPTVESITTTSVTLEQKPGEEYAWSLTDRVPVTGWKDSNEPTVKFSGLTQNTDYYFFARFKQTETHFASEASRSRPVRTNEIPVSIAITPMYRIATAGQSETVDFRLDLPLGVVPNSILWSFDDNVFTNESVDNREIKLKVAPGADPGSQPVSVTVNIDGVLYTARAEVSIIATPAVRTARLADNTATINRAKTQTNRRVNVPIVLNYMPSDFGNDRIVRLYRNYNLRNEIELTATGGPLTATLNNDNTAIVINNNSAVDKNGTFNGVTVVIGGSVVATGTLNISVIERFPQGLTAVVDRLDLFQRNSTEIKLVDNEGVEYIVDNIRFVGDTDPDNPDAPRPPRPIRINGTRVEISPTNISQTGTFPVTVRVSSPVGEYISLKAKNDNTHTVNIRVVNNTPRLALSAPSVTLLDDVDPNNHPFMGAASIRLQPDESTTVPFESFYEIKEVVSFTDRTTDMEVNVEYTSKDGFGELLITRKAGETRKSGRTMLEISFKNSDQTLELPLLISTATPRSITPSPSSRSVTVNTSHKAGEDIVTLPINLSASNLVLPDWEVIRVGKEDGGIDSARSVLRNHIDFRRGDDDNTIVFSLKPGANLSTLLTGKATRLSVPIRIGSPELMRMNNITNPANQRFVTVNLVIVSAAASFTVSRTGSINISNPESAINATIRLTNTMEKIVDVELWERKTTKVGRNEWQIEPEEISQDFEVELTGANTFRIRANDNLVPGVRQSFGIKVYLEGRDEPLTSWRNNFSKTRPDRIAYRFAFNITPAQPVSGAWQSKTAITLRAAMPQTGDDIRVRLTSPANVRLGHINIQQASMTNLRFVDAAGDRIHKAFELEQNGENSYTIRFTDGKVPAGTLNSKGARVALASNYSIRLQLWPEGTYQVNASGEMIPDVDGNPRAIVNAAGKAVSKPTLVTVRVNIRPLNPTPVG